VVVVLLGHPGVKQCWADGGNVLLEHAGSIWCWGTGAERTHKPIPTLRGWPLLPSTYEQASLVYTKCLKRDAISLSVVDNRLTCIDTPPEVFRAVATLSRPPSH
jgi:hypothetical protein